jgi:hypothetical protein
MDNASEIEKIDTPEGHQRFLRSEWRGLAAFAWSKYQAEGRGAVVIDLRRASKADAAFQIPTYYVADQSEMLAKRGGWPDAEIAEAVSSYIPDEEVVFLFLRLEGEIFHYVASDDPSPATA